MFRDSGSLSRRQFLSWLGWGAVALSVGGVVTGSAWESAGPWVGIGERLGMLSSAGRCSEGLAV